MAFYVVLINLSFLKVINLVKGEIWCNYSPSKTGKLV